MIPGLKNSMTQHGMGIVNSYDFPAKFNHEKDQESKIFAGNMLGKKDLTRYFLWGGDGNFQYRF